MDEVASRQVLWNLDGLGNVVAMYALCGVATLVALVGLIRHIELVRSGKPLREPLGSPLQLLWSGVSWGLLQRGVLRTSAGVTHLLVYLGFLVLLFTTTMVFIHHDLGIEIYQGDFYLWVTTFSDVFGFALLLGIAALAYRRYGQQADLVHTRSVDGYLLAILALLIMQGFLLEGLRIHVTKDPWGWYSPVGKGAAKLFWALSPEAGKLLHYLIWWFHTVTVCVLIALLPYSKFFHVVASAINVLFRKRPRPRGALAFEGDVEKMVEAGEEFSLGLGTIKDYNWKQLLDLEACTSCGRCQDACPAYLSGKPLSPKWIVLDTRNHALGLHSQGLLAPSALPRALQSLDSTLSREVFLLGSGLESDPQGGFRYTGNGSFRAHNHGVQKAGRAIAHSADARMSGEVIDPQAFWSCTTCMACVQACPVGIHHVDQIVGNRRNMVLMQGELPSEAQATVRALENRGNPYGPPQDRAHWLKDLDVPILKAGDSVDVLYWVGCVSAYDPRKQKIARALVQIMKAAGISFGVLGSAENCTGDPARRLGEENLYQSLAKKNIELLKSVRFETLVANCPHCFNTIKNEYPQLGQLSDGRSPEIIHHSKLLQRLIADGRLNVGEALQKVTYHDPCYLGRYNDEYAAPRDTLRGVKGLEILEMGRSREQGLCCGAGGGHFWMDLKIGQRINTIRTDEAAATGARTVATACPFCMQMMEDGVKLTNREHALDVRDIAEVIASALTTKE